MAKELLVFQHKELLKKRCQWKNLREILIMVVRDAENALNIIEK